MRYFRLYLHFVRFSFSRALEFRLDFFFRVAMDTVFYAVSLAFFTVLYGQSATVGGWSLDQAYLFVCAYLLSDALYMTVFSNNVWWLPVLVNQGGLDSYLVRPVSSLFFLSLRDFAASSFMNILIAAGLVGWALWRYPAPLGATRILAYLLLIAVGTYLLYLVRLIFLLPVFWLHSSHGLLELSWTLTHLGERPVAIYDRWLRLLLLTVIPMAFMASVPAAWLLEGPSWSLFGNVIAVTVAFTTLAVFLWRRGLAAYSSASS